MDFSKDYDTMDWILTFFNEERGDSEVSMDCVMSCRVQIEDRSLLVK